MFNELYKKSMDDIKPDELLVQRTKNLMHKELKKKPKKIYKYVTVAACLIITFSLFRVTFNSTDKVTGTQDTFVGDVGEFSGGAPISNSSPIPNAGVFIEAGNSSEVKGYFSANEADGAVYSNENVFVKIIKSVVKWFKDLFS